MMVVVETVVVEIVRNRRWRGLLYVIPVICQSLGMLGCSLDKPTLPPEVANAFMPAPGGQPPADLLAIYQSEEACSKPADAPTDDHTGMASCYCRDDIADARYVYFKYVDGSRDRNLSGVFLGLQRRIREDCGPAANGFRLARDKDWRWTGHLQ